MQINRERSVKKHLSSEPNVGLHSAPLNPAASSLSATGSIFVTLEYTYNYLAISYH